MSAAETQRMSYVRATREIVPSPSLKDFLKAAGELSGEFATNPELAEAKVFAAESLWIVLLERRARASDYANKIMRRLHSRLEAPRIPKVSRVSTTHSSTTLRRTSLENPLHVMLRNAEDIHIPDGQPMLVRANSITTTRLEEYAHLGTEVSLVVDDGPVAEALTAQYDLLYDVAAKQYGSGKLQPMHYDRSQALRIPFMHVPLVSEREEHDYVDLLSASLPVYGMGIGPIEYTLRTVDAYSQSR